MINLGITPEVIVSPIVFGVDTSQIDHPFQLHVQGSDEIFQGLINGQLDVAFISPLQYARTAGELKLVENIAVYSAGKSHYALIFFQENLHELSPIAYEPPENQYHILGKIVLNEFFELAPEWISVKKLSGLEDTLQHFPSCFLHGDVALDHSLFFENHLDIVEEWCDKTEFNYVHRVLAVRADFPDIKFVDSLCLSRELGTRNLIKIAQKYSRGRKNTWDFYFDILNERFQYTPARLTWESLGEYYKYLFYYGVVEYIPELKFL